MPGRDRREDLLLVLLQAVDRAAEIARHVDVGLGDRRFFFFVLFAFVAIVIMAVVAVMPRRVSRDFAARAA